MIYANKAPKFGHMSFGKLCLKKCFKKIAVAGKNTFVPISQEWQGCFMLGFSGLTLVHIPNICGYMITQALIRLGFNQLLLPMQLWMPFSPQWP